MANPLSKMSPAGKRSMVVLVIVVLIMTGIGAALMSQVLNKVSPGSTGPAVASSSKSLPPAPSPGKPAVKISTAEENLLQLQLEEAWRNGDWNKAISTLSTILASDPGNAEMHARLYQAHVNLGWQLLVATKLKDAKVQFELALKIKPAGTEAQEGLRLVNQQIVETPTASPLLPTPAPPVCTPTQPPPCPTSAPCAVALAVVCPPQPAVAPPPGFACHIVHTGDTLFGLARRYGTTVEAIMAANHLPTCTIYICQRLLIPAGPQPVCPAPCPLVAPSAARIHVVQSGDNLFRLALRFNTSIAGIMQANGLTTTNIRIGQRLIIP